MPDLHDIAESALRNLALHYYAKAVGRNAFEMNGLTIEQAVKKYPYVLPRNEDGTINVWDSTFGLSGSTFYHWRLAALYDTMANVAHEVTGGDDSAFDMAPDGAAQIDLLVDPENVDWLNELTIGEHHYKSLHPDDHVHFMDATSAIVWAQVPGCDDEDCDIC